MVTNAELLKGNKTQTEDKNLEPADNSKVLEEIAALESKLASLKEQAGVCDGMPRGNLKNPIVFIAPYRNFQLTLKEPLLDANGFVQYDEKGNLRVKIIASIRFHNRRAYIYNAKIAAMMMNKDVLGPNKLVVLSNIREKVEGKK